MNRRQSPSAALKVAVLALLLVGTALPYGCAAPAAQMATPAATAQATITPTSAAAAPIAPVSDQELTNLGCVCHLQSEQGAPPVSALASLPESRITQVVRQGRGTMPAWSSENLSDQLLTRIVDWLTSGQQAAPSSATPPTP